MIFQCKSSNTHTTTMYSRSPYKVIPQPLFSEYTMNGQIPILHTWIDGRNELTVENWTHEYVYSFMQNYSLENIKNNSYKDEPYPNATQWIFTALKKYNITHQHVAVIGSVTPWIEAMLLNLNNRVTTVGCNASSVSYSNLDAISYNEFAKSDVKYDCVITYSWIEHCGLGRYGDPLDPNGDLNTMDAIHHHLIDHGKLIWGAPVGHDAFVWNAHRVYGRIRIPKMFLGFRELEWIDMDREKLLNLPLQNNSVNAVVVLEKCDK